MPTSLAKSAQDAVAVGLLEPVDLKGIHDLKYLNQILKKQGGAAISAKLGTAKSGRGAGTQGSAEG